MFTKEFLKENPDLTKVWIQEENKMVSMTEPDGAIRVSDMYNRFVSGTMPNVQMNALNGPDETFNDILPAGIDVFSAVEISNRFEETMRSYIETEKAKNLEANERKELERLKSKYASLDSNSAVSSETAESTKRSEV